MPEVEAMIKPSVASRAYLDVSRVSDGRYCVAVVRNGIWSRKSYTATAQAVVKQAQRAGNLPIQTTDHELRTLCVDHQISISDDYGQ